MCAQALTHTYYRTSFSFTTDKNSRLAPSKMIGLFPQCSIKKNKPTPTLQQIWNDLWHYLKMQNKNYICTFVSQPTIHTNVQSGPYIFGQGHIFCNFVDFKISQSSCNWSVDFSFNARSSPEILHSGITGLFSFFIDSLSNFRGSKVIGYTNYKSKYCFQYLEENFLPLPGPLMQMHLVAAFL